MDSADFGSKEAGIKGGEARAKALSGEKRSEIARLGAMARWQQEGHAPVPIATHGSPDRPLRIGELEIPCYVLSDKRRVIVQRGMMTALDMSQGTAGRGGGDRLAKFISSKAIKPWISAELADVIKEPIRFRIQGGNIAYGYEATVLADLCAAVLEARQKGKLHYQQEHIAEQAEILVRSFAKVGIIALVDEATGYQRDRKRDELAQILEAFVAKEIQKYLKTFDLEFYELICQLRGEPLERAKKRPKYFGILTNNLIYDRLAPGVRQELQRLSPANEQGRRKGKLYDWLTPDYGHPRLKAHYEGVTTGMKFAKLQGLNWTSFLKLLDTTHPKFKPMPLFESQEQKALPPAHGDS